MHTYNLQEVGLAKALVSKGLVCDIMYYTNEHQEIIEKVSFDEGRRSFHIIWLKGFVFLGEGIYPSLKKYVDDYDIVQIGGYNNFMVKTAIKNYPEKLIVYQGPYRSDFNRRYLFRAKLLDTFLWTGKERRSITAITKSQLASDYLFECGLRDVTTIGVGLDVDYIEHNEADDQKDKYSTSVRDFKSGGRLLLYIGVFEERRNAMFLLDIFKELLKIDAGYKLLLIGKGEKDYMRSFFKRAKEYGTLNNLLHYEKVEHKYIRTLYEMSEAFILPTRYDIYGMVLLEAMYFGVPVFTTMNGGSSTIIKNGENGYILSDFSGRIWADCIDNVMKKEELFKRIRTNAQKTIRHKYVWNNMVDDFIGVYKRKLAGKAL